MYESIKNFNKQFLYEPLIINQENLQKKITEKKSFIVVGMGGSALAPLLLKKCETENHITINHDYKLPKIPLEDLKEKLIILSSYSGNTEEVLDAFGEAREKNLDMAVITAGGKLLALAKENNIPYVELPSTGIQPRMALGYSVKAFLKLMGKEEELKEISKLTESLNPILYEESGKALAGKIRNFIPVIYTSNHNSFIAYNWKIKLNETGKIPAFFNVLPELNHNEMSGFSADSATYELSNGFYFIILKDANDNPKILKRMNILEKLYKDRNLKTEALEIKGENIWQKIFGAIVLADWTAYHTALLYGLDPEQVPMVEEFKKLIA